jgi:hypothetical protein
VAGGTFLSLIPLPTEEEAPFMSPPFPCTTANLPILWVILDPPPKVSLSTVEK